MKVSLATSLHLDHGTMTLDHEPGDPLPMQSFVPTGLLCLKAYAESSGVDADIRVTELNGLINSGFIPNDDAFHERLVDAFLAPDDGLVGLMTDADSLHHTITMARLLKQRSPETLVCLGGPASSPISELVLERFPFIDMVVRGEGELTFAETLRGLDDEERLAEVLGLTWRSGEKIVQNPDRQVMPGLGELPIPEFEAYGMDPDAPIYLDVGRGCPFKCHFCATAPFWNRRFRMKPIERIVQELTLLRDRYHRNHVGFAHDIFTANRRWTLEFCRHLIDNPVDMTWACSTRTDIIDREVLEAMSAAGCVEIYYGIESGSQAMQAAIHKNLDLDRSREVVDITSSVGIRPVTGFIVGYPMETRETFNETLTRFFEFLQVGGYRAHLFTLCPFQEAPMYKDGHKISRRAAYFELPLTAGPAGAGEKLRAEHPDVFTSLYRFDTPDLPADLIDGTEEIASRLVVFKALWPRMLEHYDSPMDWYERWIGWIRRFNAEHRPSTSLPSHGEIDDMMTFVEEELDRIGLTGSPLSSLLQYEREKLRASRELTNFPGREPEAKRHDDLTPDTVLTRGCDYLLSPLQHDLGALLNGGEVRSAAGRMAVFAKVEGEDMLTMQVGERAARILSRARRPRRIRDLVRTLGANGSNGADGQALAETTQIVGALIERGLLVRVDHRAWDEGGLMPGSRGEHELQERFNNVARAYAFYDNQMLDHLNPLMREYVARQSLFFVGTSDARGNCDCSLRNGEPGVVRVLDERTLIYPEYRGNGVMASLGNIAENPHIGVFFGDFYQSTVGLHVNGTASLLPHDELASSLAGQDELLAVLEQENEKPLETWVRIEVQEAYIHCSKHIPLLKQLDKDVYWGTDDRGCKGGDYFRVRFRTTSKRLPTPVPPSAEKEGSAP
ncbi:B12-binding domain-containing radical SAM protein [Amycolatopsis nigrescens]|uniref:B12-binding domain-containing radical SAM protein n=1 Tax=Amycolatopsis nigrescens TaxID=381445 RepID=UPI0003781045|nr:B12-binding domain-containing radical SAM protein [Amycolatopsis nigrescens]